MNQSLTTMRRVEVIALCRSSINHINEERKKRNGESIDKNRRKLWFGFGRLQTDEEVEESMGSSFFGDWPSIYAWQSLETSERLLALALACPDQTTMLITVEDFHAIK